MVISSSAADLFETFEIEFDAGREPVFHGGELLSGSVKIKLKYETIINAIRIQFRGRAVWIGSGKKIDKEGRREKVYFDRSLILLERPPGHPEPGHFTWQANFQYSLPFEIPIPCGCETSYENSAAFIRYYCRAMLETEKGEKYLAKKGFTIVSPPDLQHLVPSPSEPISRIETIKFGGCCCKNKITAELKLPKSSYAPGENVIGVLSIDSTAKNALDFIEVRLIDTVERIEELENNANKEPNNNEGAKMDGSTLLTNKKEKKQNVHIQTQNQRVLVGRKLDRESLMINNDGQKRPVISFSDIIFVQIPAVVPTIQKEAISPFSQSQTEQKIEDEVQENRKFAKLLESPSSATLMARAEKFIGVQYFLQISLGTHILMEVPIVVHQIPIYAKGIEFRPFANGAQPIKEADEADLQCYGSLTFQPSYPIYVDLAVDVTKDQTIPFQSNGKQQNGVTIASNGHNNGQQDGSNEESSNVEAHTTIGQVALLTAAASQEREQNKIENRDFLATEEKDATGVQEMNGEKLPENFHEESVALADVNGYTEIVLAVNPEVNENGITNFVEQEELKLEDGEVEVRNAGNSVCEIEPEVQVNLQMETSITD